MGETRILIRTGDLLNASGVLVHQVNAVTTVGKGLSAAVFSRWPAADIYQAQTPREPGQCLITILPVAAVAVANIVGQRLPGKPKHPETAQMREAWFAEALSALARWLHGIPFGTLIPVNFPYGIGCGLAGGDWDHYFKMIEAFAATVPANPVIIWRLPG